MAKGSARRGGAAGELGGAGRRIVGAAGAIALAGLLGGCVSVNEYRKLEHDVRVLQQQRGGTPTSREQVADLSTRLDAVQTQVDQLQGRVEVAEHQSEQALQEAKAARREAAGAVAPAPPAPLAHEPAPAPSEPPPLGTPSGKAVAAAPQPAPGARGAAVASPAPAEPAPGSSPGAINVTPDEVSAYRSAYAAWRRNDTDACIDQFRNFLQAHPTSTYADDAAYWMADCYFKKGDYKTAVLRFDDVVARYPKGNKAADALYRQGEALLRLGSGYAKAASKAFERVVKEYPDSPRAPEAKRQLALLGAG